MLRKVYPKFLQAKHRSTWDHHLNKLARPQVIYALYKKFQGCLFLGFGEEDFLGVFTMYGHGGHLVSRLRPFEQFFVLLIPGGSVWNMVTIGPRVSEQNVFENVNSWNLETKVKGHPLTLSLIYFHILG